MHIQLPKYLPDWLLILVASKLVASALLVSFAG
jgi:hypothetical protein